MSALVPAHTWTHARTCACFMIANARARACTCVNTPSVAHSDERLDCPNVSYFIDIVIILKYLFTSSKKNKFKSHKNQIVSDKWGQMWSNWYKWSRLGPIWKALPRQSFWSVACLGKWNSTLTCQFWAVLGSFWVNLEWLCTTHCGSVLLLVTVRDST